MRAGLLLLVLLLSVPASARREGNTFTLASGCIGCHSDGDQPSVTVEQVTPGPFVEGDSVVFHVVMTSLGRAGHKAAFAASVRAGVGTFLAGADTEVCDNTQNHVCPGRGDGNAIRDVSLRDFVDGRYEWDIELTNLGGGEHTLSVGATDANNDGESTGDENASAELRFSVAEGEGEGEGEGDGEGEGEGCSAVASGGAAPRGASALLALALVLTRARRSA